MPKNDPNYQQIWRKQCEAMEIVTLFAVVDPKAWVGMLEKSIRPALLPWEFRLVEMDTAVRFFVKICEEDIDGNRPLLSLQDAKERAFGRVDTTQEEEEDAADRRWPGELVAHLLEPVKPSERSPEYLETREKILRQAGIDLGGRSSEVASIPIVLEVRLSEPHPALFPAPLADAYSRPQPAAPFVLDSVRMHYDDAGLSEDWIDDWCTYMSSKRLPLTHLELTGNGLQRRNVLPLLRRELLSDSRANPLKELTLQVPRGDFSYPGLFSLLALRSDVKTLRLQRANEIGPAVEYEEQAHRRVWRWLGFLLFSPYSNAAFHTLEVTDMDLSADNVQELNAIRETNNPFQLLHPRLNSTERSKPSRTVRVTEDIDEVVPILNVQVEEDEENEDEEAERIMWISVNWLPLSHGAASYPVIHDDESQSTVDVLIAGDGVVSFDRSKVEFAPATLKADTTPSRSIRRLNIRLDANDAGKASGLVAFIEMFGGTLESLSIRATGYWILDVATLHEIVEACPM